MDCRGKRVSRVSARVVLTVKSTSFIVRPREDGRRVLNGLMHEDLEARVRLINHQVDRLLAALKG